MRILIRAVLLGPLLVAAAVGCSPSGEGMATNSEGERPSVGRGQSQGKPTVTREELEKAVSDLEACLSGSGIGLVNSGLDPVTQQRFILSFPAPGVPDDRLTSTVDSCRSGHLDEIEAQYANSHAPEMAPELLDSTLTCLTGKGIEAPTGTRSPYELVQKVPTNKQRDLTDCALGAMERLYPDFPAYSFP